MGGMLGFLIIYKTKNIVIFIKNLKYDKDIIVGFKSRLPQEIDYLYLDKSLKLNTHLVLENHKFRYAKLSLSEKTIFDYQHLTIWLSARKYKAIRQIFEEDTEIYDKRDLIKKVIALSEEFN